MNKKEDVYKTTNEILIGLEYIYPDIDLLSKIRLTLKRLTFDPFDDRVRFNDLFNLIETLKSLPLTPYLRNIVSAPNSQEKVIATYKLMEHLSYDPIYENFRLILKYSGLDGDHSETIEKIMIQWLKDKSQEPSSAYCSQLVSLLLEQDFFEKTEKTMDFYNFFYQNSPPGQKTLKSLPLTPYLRNIVSAPNSQEKVIATYKLMEHLSYDPIYENFRLILKYSGLDGDHSETIEKIMIQWLKDKSQEPSSAYCSQLVSLLLEQDFFEKTEKTMDFYNFFYQNSPPGQKTLKSLPLTPYLRNIVSAPNSQEKVIATYKLMEHLSYDPIYENFRLILKYSGLDGDHSETIEKIMIQWLKDKSQEPSSAYCSQLVSLLLEQDFFEKTEKTMDFYNFFYQNSPPGQKTLKSLPLTPYLRNIVSAPNSQEKVIATYKLMEHLSYDPIYENFRLILKYSGLDGDHSETIEKIMIQWLKDKSQEPSSAYCSQLVSLLLEQDFFEKTEKTMDFYNFFYQNSLLKQLKKAYRHFILENSSLQFLNFIYQATGKSLFNQIKVIQDKYRDFPIHESFSKGQVLSKLWARDCLMDLNLDSCKTGLILCGWSGVLANLLLEKLFDGIMSVDNNPDCEPVAIRLNYEDYTEGRFNAVTRDIFDLDYHQWDLAVNKFNGKPSHFDIIVNTSCEHIKSFDKWYKLLPKGQLLLLQSNDFFEIEEHINCVDSLEAFKAMVPMKHLLFAGELPFENYTRFMLIGYK